MTNIFQGHTHANKPFITERWEWRPSQSPDWIEVTAEPEFDVRTSPRGGFIVRDFLRQRTVSVGSLAEAKEWCEGQAEND